MNRTIPFATELKASPESEPTRSTQGNLHSAASTPWLVAENAEVIVSLLRGLAVNDQAHDPEGMKKNLQ